MKYDRAWFRSRPHTCPSSYCDPCARRAMVAYAWRLRKKELEKKLKDALKH